MADHRAEQIAAAVKGLILDLSTTGKNVFKGRAHNFTDADLPALSVYIDSEQPLSEYNDNLIDRQLSIVVEGYTKPTDADQVDTILNQIRKEVTIAINADRQLGLSDFVIDTMEDGASYTLEGEADNVIGVVSTIWRVHYRRSMTDPSQ